MRIIDYYMSSERDRETWLDSFSITSGLRYFGGKSVIGKYLMNRICNMACRMTENGKKPHIFIDAFAGGGKIALSIPEGWFDMIVLNDLNYGVYSFFKSCKEKPLALVKLIEEIGEVYDENMFRYFTLNRAHGNQKKSESYRKRKQLCKIKLMDISADEAKEISGIQHYDFYEAHFKYMYKEPVNELVAAAMTYFVTQTSWNGDTEPATVTYRLSVADNKEGNFSAFNEKEKIERMVNRAKKHVFHVHNMMVKKNIVVENLDYRELIKKYNGKEFSDLTGTIDKNDSYTAKNILWYFDPPYHPATLAGGKPAAYEDTFPIQMTLEMTKILHNDKDYIEKYGELFYFIKSDYCPKDCYDDKKKALDFAKQKYAEKWNKGNATQQDKDIVDKLQKAVDELKDHYHDFDCLEEGEYYREEIGTFSKGGEGTENNKTKGTEFVWCRG